MGAASGELQILTPTDTEIVMTWEFNAPCDLVFEAHTSCEHMSHWWGPRRYEVVKCEVDFQEGGKWRIVHRGPDGDEHAFSGEYREIVRPERIVWTFKYEGAPGDPGVETLTLEEDDGKTTLRTVSYFDNVQIRDEVLESGMLEGARETWERLAEYLEEL